MVSSHLISIHLVCAFSQSIIEFIPDLERFIYFMVLMNAMNDEMGSITIIEVIFI